MSMLIRKYRYVLVLLFFLGFAGLLSIHALQPLTSNNSITVVVNRMPTALFKPDQATQMRVREAYGKLPLSFQSIEKEHDKQPQFLSQGSNYKFLLTATEAVFALEAQHTNTQMRMQFVGANYESKLTRTERTPGKYNYYVGNDSKNWRIDVPHYTRVSYEDVYPGVDLIYYGNQKQLEYDFIVSPNADPNIIAVNFQGADNLEVDSQGDLILHTKAGPVLQHKPRVYQSIDGIEEPVACNYVLKGKTEIGFKLGTYDISRPLTIDPVLSYAKSLRGNSEDEGISITVDANGNAYITGVTNSGNFPTGNPLQAVYAGSGDVFVTKLNTSGELVYSTYLGGSNSDQGNGIAIDSLGNAYIAGTTSSINFPILNAVQSSNAGRDDIFIAQLSASGTLLYSTYLGGDNDDRGNSITVSSAGNAYVTGETRSTNFPTINSLQATYSGNIDAFISQLSTSGTLLYSTYLGGSNFDIGNGITIDSAGSVYVAGQTRSNDFPLSKPLQATNGGLEDVFVAKLDPDGNSLNYSTYLGGGNIDVGLSIAVDNTGNAYVTGITSSRDFPTVNALQAAYGGIPSDAFVVKLDASGSKLLYSTYLGGNNDDRGLSIGVDTIGNVYVVGSTASPNFPLANPMQAIHGGSLDAFTAKLSSTGDRLIYSTYFGGNDLDLGRGMAIDANGAAYITGSSASANLPLTSAQPTSSNIEALDIIVGKDVFITKIADPIAEVDFSLSFNPTTIAVRRGESVKATVNINRIGGFAGNIKVAPPNTKSTKKLKLKITPRTGSTTGASVAFTIKAKQKSPVGTQQLVFTGQDESGRVRSNTVTVVIQ
ncbi:MAG: SBBP repeat-containing protein [Acidobacteriota bacterium]